MLTQEQRDKLKTMAEVHNHTDRDEPYVNVQCRVEVASAVAVYGATVAEVKALTDEELNYFCFLTCQDPYSQQNDGSITLKHEDWSEFLDYVEEV
jgi:hypothetical protein